MKVVYLGNCLHIFDTAHRKFIKLSAKNLQTAMGPTYASYTRNRIINHIHTYFRTINQSKR